MEPERYLEIFLEVMEYSKNFPAGKLIHELYEELIREHDARTKAEADTWRSIVKRNTIYTQNVSPESTGQNKKIACTPK